MTIEYPVSAEDQLAIVGTLYNFGAGIDACDQSLIESALTHDCEIDFGPAARFMGIDFPLLKGSVETAAALAASVGKLDTTHVVTNPRIELIPDPDDPGFAVRLQAIVEAAHFPPGNHSRRCVMKNRYYATLLKYVDGWKLLKVSVQCAWYDGDPQVLLGN